MRKPGAPRSLVLVLVFGLCFLLFAGCNSLIGADAPHLVDSLGGSGGSAGVVGGCLLASDCPDAQICLFRQCSSQCVADKDCQFGRCLQTAAGNACVVPASATCQSEEDCPAGSQCKDHACRSTCTGNADCLEDQTCIGEGCVGNDLTHDPSSGVGGTSGGSGEGGAGGGAGGDDTSSAGVSSGGTSGSGGLSGGGSGGGGVSDGTAIGTLGTQCTKTGSLACAGHAKRGQLICQNGTWQANGTCSGNNLCDTTPGANAGSCQPIVAECDGKATGARFCRGTETDLRECGLDLVSASVVQSCMYVCSAGACSGECHPDDKQCKPDAVTPQTCQAGTWKDDKACGYQCDPATGKCIAAGCKDGVKNGDETDKDCGGSCGGCPIMGACKLNGDCVGPSSAHCVNLKCVPAACNDGVPNGDETDTDCGGSCGKCAVDQACIGNPDCALPASGHCSGNKCVAAACSDNILNGNETAKDCGGSCPADCALGDACGGDGDCASGACLNKKCVACKQDTKQCAGAAVQTCQPNGTWGGGVPCTVVNGTGACSGGVCSVSSCSNGFGDCDLQYSTGCEVSLNLPSGCGTNCLNRLTCSSNNGTPTCPNGACVLSCTGGFADCGGVNDGCEKQLNSVTSCGVCGATTMCSSPSQKCSGGGCVSNDPYAVGQSSSAGWTEFTITDNILYAVPVVVPKSGTLQFLRVLGGTGTPGGAQARMGIWADDGAGHPGTFIAQTANITMTSGVNSAAPSPLGPALIGGKTYWVGAKFVNGVHVYQHASPGLVGYTLGQNFGVVPSAANWTMGTTFSDTALNLFMIVQDTPP